ncbi:MAG TPA: glutamate--tRNA ligase [Phycisphaerales bacterium]|nr:glutamate--tRNA ligase [Phycisphaerales bacterium]HIN83894.1 glutamate--tRNA ligase [Phycisphaerales bacterium]
MSTNVKTRFAPSPTGHLHVGGARTAIYCWAFAKANGGKFLLRIEDTDQKRSSEQATTGFFNDLSWLKILWDEGPTIENTGGGNEGPYYQSKRLDLYKEQLDTLFELELAYYAFETPDELQAERKKARAEKRAYRYNRKSLELSKETVNQFLAEGKPHVVRFKVPEGGPLTVTDCVVGDVTVERTEVDDFVIFKGDGFPTYHFAVIVDDALMHVTHVLRGQEHLNNTFKHILLQEALGFERPTYAHISLIFNPDGSKMSKRDKDKALRKYVRENNIESSPIVCITDEAWSVWQSSKDNQLETEAATALAAELGIELPEVNVDDFKKAGYMPEVLLNYLCLLGWSPGNDIEHFDSDFLIEKFSLDRIVKSPAKFDRAKLLAFNLDALQKLSAEEFESRLLHWCEEYAPEFAALEQFSLFASANHERSKTFRDAIVTSSFITVDDEAIVWPETKPVKKALLKGEASGLSRMPAIIEAFKQVESWNAEAIDSCLHTLADTLAEGNLGKVAQPVRIAVAGGPVSPPIGDTLILLGKKSTLRRLERCHEFFASTCDA